MASQDRDEKDQMTLAQIVKRMRESMAAQLEYEELRAKIARKRFDSLRAEGFSETDALNIISKSY